MFSWFKQQNYQYNNMSDFEPMTVEKIINTDPASVNPNLKEDSTRLTGLQKDGINLLFVLKKNEKNIKNENIIKNGRKRAIDNFLINRGLKTNRELETIINDAENELDKENTERIKLQQKQEEIERRLAKLKLGGKQTKKRKQRKNTKRKKATKNKLKLKRVRSSYQKLY